MTTQEYTIGKKKIKKVFDERTNLYNYEMENNDLKKPNDSLLNDERYDYSEHDINAEKVKNFIFDFVIPEVLESLLKSPEDGKIIVDHESYTQIAAKAKELYGIEL